VEIQLGPGGGTASKTKDKDKNEKPVRFDEVVHLLLQGNVRDLVIPGTLAKNYTKIKEAYLGLP